MASTSSSSSGFPLVNISLTVPEQGVSSFSDPSKIPVSSIKVNPVDFKIHSCVMEILTDLSKDIVFYLGVAFSKPLKFKLILSQEKGAVIDNSRITAIVRNAQSGVGFAVDAEQARQLGMMHLKQAEVSEKSRAETLAQHGRPLVFFDPVSLILNQNEICESVELNMQVTPFFSSDQGGGLTTAAFRFPHMYIDMLSSYEYRRLTEDLKVCLVGPGLSTPEKSLAQCPQLAELMAIFPRGKFTLLDNNEKALNILRGQVDSMKVITYDPLTYRMLTINLPENCYKAPDQFQAGLKTMAESWASQARSPANAAQMLKGVGKINFMLLNVDSKDFEVKEFDINSPLFAGDERFDVMVATMSMVHAFDEGEPDIQQVFPKYLAALKSQGSLYIDAPLFNDILMPAYGCDTAEEFAAKLSKELKTVFSVKRLGIESYLPGSNGDVTILPSPALADKEKPDRGFNSITTSTVFVLSKKG